MQRVNYKTIDNLNLNFLTFRSHSGSTKEHSALLSTCIKLSSVFKPFTLSIFEWLLKTGFIVVEAEEAKHVSYKYMY